MSLVLSDLSLDALVDPFLARVNREFVAKQNWLARQILEPVIESLIAIKLDPLAEDLAQKAVAHIRAIVEDWLRGDRKVGLADYADQRLSATAQMDLVAAGFNPLTIFAILQTAFVLIEKLLPYFQRTVNATSEDGSGDTFVLAIESDEELAMALAA